MPARDTVLEMPGKKKRDGKAAGARPPAAGGAAPDEGATRYGSGVVRLSPELAFRLRMIADFRGQSIADLLEPTLRPIVAAWWAVMVKEAQEMGGE